MIISVSEGFEENRKSKKKSIIFTPLLTPYSKIETNSDYSHLNPTTFIKIISRTLTTQFLYLICLADIKNVLNWSYTPHNSQFNIFELKYVNHCREHNQYSHKLHIKTDARLPLSPSINLQPASVRPWRIHI